MIDFYRARAAGQDPGTVVIVAEDTEAGILLGWVPNTGLWHRATELENDYLFGDDNGTYEPITRAEAGRLVQQVKPFDESRDPARRLMDKRRAQPPAELRTNTDLGLEALE